MITPKLKLINVKKEFFDGSVAAVDGIDLTIQAGETVALLGPSGCGKSTTLNMIVGLEQPTSGDILIDGQSVLDVPAGKRNVGLVFQDYAVFTHMTVYKNLAFGLEIRRKSRSEIDRAVSEVAALLGMESHLNVKASELGGSELQRVAIGRTLVTKPALLLLDEPLSNLEAAARQTMRKELRRLQAEIGLTIIYVTHDQVEALSLADRIAIMNAGKIQQYAETDVVCARPDHTFVAGFMGSPPMNLLRGQLEQAGNELVFKANNSTLAIPLQRSPKPAQLGMPIITGIRPHKVRLVKASDARMTAVVERLEPRGPEVILTLAVGETTFKAVAPGDLEIDEETSVGLALDPADLVHFSAETSRSVTL